MRNVVRAICRRRHVAAQKLMSPLRAGLNPLEASRDRKVYGLVVASLEVQKGMILDRSPVSAKEHAFTEEVQGAGDLAPAAPRHDEKDLIGQRRPDSAEKVPREIGTPPL